MAINFIYNDLIPVEDYLKNILAVERYSEITFNGTSNYANIKNVVDSLDGFVFYHFKDLNDIDSFNDTNNLNKTLVFSSNMFVTNDYDLENLLQRISLIDTNIIFPYKDADSNVSHYPVIALNSLTKKFSSLVSNGILYKDPSIFICNEIGDNESFHKPESILYIDSFDSFLELYQNRHKSRYFNTLENAGDLIVKRSKNHQKIKKEYESYYHLPDDMKRFFVQPFNHVVGKRESSYSMQLYKVPDVALLWVNESIDCVNFKKFLLRVFVFLKNRSSKSVLENDGSLDALYIAKLKDRIDSFRGLDSYKGINNILVYANDGNGVDAIYNKFIELYSSYSKRVSRSKLCMSHGDLCFSNILYHKESNFLKFIDPRGGESASEIYLDEYYDLAKLSHSILGGYDFVVSGLYSIELGRDFQIKINSVLFDSNIEQKKIFKTMVEENNYDYTFVRLCEASLFLSMLPLHADDPNRMLAFLITADNILGEVEKLIN